MEDEDQNNHRAAEKDDSSPSAAMHINGLIVPSKNTNNKSNFLTVTQRSMTMNTFPQYCNNFNRLYFFLRPWNLSMTGVPRPGPLGTSTSINNGPLFVLSQQQVLYINFNNVWIHLYTNKYYITSTFHKQRTYFISKYRKTKTFLEEQMNKITQFQIKTSQQPIALVTHGLFTHIIQEIKDRNEKIQINVIQPLKNNATYGIINILQKLTEYNFNVAIIKQAEKCHQCPYVNLIYKLKQGRLPLAPSYLLKQAQQKFQQFDYILNQQQGENILILYVDVLRMLRIAPIDEEIPSYYQLMRKATIIKFYIYFDQSCEAKIKQYYSYMNEFLQTRGLTLFYNTFLQILINSNLLDIQISRRHIFIMFVAFYNQSIQYLSRYQKQQKTEAHLFIQFIYFYGSEFHIKKQLIDIESTQGNFLQRNIQQLNQPSQFIGIAMKDPAFEDPILTPNESLKLFCWMQDLLVKIHNIKLEIIQQILNHFPHCIDSNDLISKVCEQMKEYPMFMLVKRELQPF